jgi:hypothetical protein
MKLPEDSHPGYDDLLARAAVVLRLPFTEFTPDSHMAASKLMVDEADELYAAWDGSLRGHTAAPPTWSPECQVHRRGAASAVRQLEPGHSPPPAPPAPPRRKAGNEMEPGRLPRH